MAQINLQKATNIDIHIIKTIAEQSWRENYVDIISNAQIEYMLDLMYSEKEISAHLANDHYHYYIISEENRNVGIMGFEVHFEPKTTKLHRIYLLKSEKGKGLGTFAINFLKTFAKEQGDEKIILNVNKNNPAKYSYQSQGFSIEKEVLIDIGGGFLMDDFVMSFQL